MVGRGMFSPHARLTSENTAKIEKKIRVFRLDMGMIKDPFDWKK
jgi:hypothetical protein